jgi:hypothetical protein
MPIINRYTDFQSYFKDISPLLESNEAANNLPLGILLQNQNSAYREEFILIGVFDQGKPVLAAQQLDRAMILTGSINHVGALAKYLIENQLKAISLLGESPLVIAFANELKAGINVSWKTKVNQRIYKIEKVKTIASSPGHFRPASHEDFKIALDYVKAFYASIDESFYAPVAPQMIKAFIEKQTLFVWDHDGVVSIAKKARPSKNGIVVNTVYTPESKRGNGYASSCIAALSKHLLKEYKFCSLYTDLGNPTSNRIYMNIGYQPVIDCQSIELNYRS